jgi:hypothetical protein
MPLGATPSRWCVCQFHHFRASNCFTFNQLLKTPEGLSTSVSIIITTFCTNCLSGSFPLRRAANWGKKRTDHVRLRLDGTHSRLDGIVARLVLQRGRLSGAMLDNFTHPARNTGSSAVTISVVKTCRWQPRMLRRSGCLHRLPCSAHS